MAGKIETAVVPGWLMFSEDIIKSLECGMTTCEDILGPKPTEDPSAEKGVQVTSGFANELQCNLLYIRRLADDLHCNLQRIRSAFKDE